VSAKINDDFEQVKSFLSTYGLSSLVGNASYIAELKRAHKRYFGALTLIAEIDTQLPAKRTKRLGTTVDYFKESVSDLNSALFCLATCAHKPGRVMVRSALETTAKGILATESLALLRQKSVFSIVKEARATKYCKESLPRTYFDRLTTLYSELCKDVHTASHENMAMITALNNYATYDSAKSHALEEVLVDAARIIASLQAMYFHNQYNSMHFSNRPIVRSSLPVDVIRRLAGA